MNGIEDQMINTATVFVKLPRGEAFERAREFIAMVRENDPPPTYGEIRDIYRGAMSPAGNILYRCKFVCD